MNKERSSTLKMKKSMIKKFAKIFVTLALLGYLILKINLNQLLSNLLEINVSYLCLFALSNIIGFFLIVINGKYY